MITSENGRRLIKSFEGLSLKAYLCPANVLTIGYGHTGDDVKAGQVITEAQAEELLSVDLRRFERCIDSAVTVEINQNQFDALSSFVFNIGTEAFKKSTLLKLLNSGKAILASNQFERWNKSGDNELPGLTRRRLAEKKLFLS